MAVLETPRPNTEATKSLFISDAQMEEFRAITARQFEEMGIEYILMPQRQKSAQ